MDGTLSYIQDAWQALFQRSIDWIIVHGPIILFIILTAWLAREFAANIVLRLLKRGLREDYYPTKSDRDKRIQTFKSTINPIINLGIYLIAGVMIISEIGVNTTPLIAGAGIVGVALGIGAQDLIKDIATGIFVIGENQYRIGDTVELAGTLGIVEDITLRTTVVRDFNGSLHHIQNGAVDVTTNRTMLYSGINEKVVVGLDSDIDQVEHVINHIGNRLAARSEFKDTIIKAPSFSGVSGIDTNGIEVYFSAQTIPGEYWLLRSEFYRQMFIEFKKAGIELPYQHIQLLQKQPEAKLKSNK